MAEFVTVRHPDVDVTARVARTALPHLDSRWQVVTDDQPAEDGADPGAAPSTTSSTSRPARRRTRKTTTPSTSEQDGAS